ncbi:hypothetical protein [Jiangella asiatica]|uniref:hypothetical protein n=1 Tax=Jiangella asiatica TaxID=2530372 RepID=UPI0013A5EDB2|nr:hypothetical protein [Jiangella asiatica]
MRQDSGMSNDLTRRRFLQGNAAVLAAGAVLGAKLPGAHGAESTATSAWEPVPPVDLGELSPGDFLDEELDLPYYLAHFHTVANSVVESGPNRGFIDIAVWRNPEQQDPANARVMENVLSFAYFYTKDRPWNAYRGSEPVRARLEAALRFLMSLQDDQGLYPWPGKSWSTGYGTAAFITKFLGETLVLLNGTPSIDSELFDDVMAAQRRSLHYLLTEQEWYHFAVQFPNQWTCIWAGAAAYLHLRDDDEIEELFVKRLDDSPDHFQTASGAYPEEHYVDWNYTFGTHRSNERMTRHYLLQRARGRRQLGVLRTMLERWLDLLSYNVLVEPEGRGFILNSAVETRSTRRYVDHVAHPEAQEIPLARAFAPSSRELAEQRARTRAGLDQAWPEVGPLRVGEQFGFSPYTFMHRDHDRWYPTDQQRQQAIQLLPYVARQSFIHQRVDSKLAIHMTYVRRPTYYAAFNSGRRTHAQQRLGLGVLWHPVLGTVMQTQSDWQSSGTWGTRAGGASREEAGTSTPRFFVDGNPVAPWAHTNRDLPTGDLLITYSLGSGNTKSVEFHDDEILVTTSYAGEFTEDFPIVFYPDVDDVVREPGLFVLRRDGVELRVEAPGAGRPSFPISSTTIHTGPPHAFIFEQVDLREADPLAGAKRLGTMRFSAVDELSYRISIAAAS